MNYDTLERDGLIEKISFSEEDIEGLIGIANRDISTAEYVMAHDVDWALTIAYNSVLQVLLAIMHKEGFRPIKTVSELEAKGGIGFAKEFVAKMTKQKIR